MTPAVRLERLRRPAFGRHGRKVIGAICGWEMAALLPGSPVPTVSQTVKQYPAIGWALLVLLTHHWFLEAPVLIEIVALQPPVTVTPMA